MTQLDKIESELKSQFKREPEQINVYDCFIKSSYIYNSGIRIHHAPRTTVKQLNDFLNESK